MKTVKPKALDAPLSSLPLSPEEGFVLSRIDGRLSVRDLVALTGIDQQRMEQIVTKLESHGAVQVDPTDSTRELPPPPKPAGQASLADFAGALGMDPTGFADAGEGEGRRESRSDSPPPITAEESSAVIDETVEEQPPMQLDAEDRAAATEQAAEETEEVANNERNYRQLYETKFHPLPTDARVRAAQTAAGSELLALCFDADPRVIAALLENPKAGLDHARLIAFHHRTGAGLELLSRRMEVTRDMGVERRLLRNPQCGEVVLQRIMSSKQLQQTFKICMDRDVPELTRTKTRGHLRKKWQTAPPEDRSNLVLRTEGRCLPMMTGCTFDARTTSILCGKPIVSGLFIQNLAKFVATPPVLLAHVVKQPFVRKNLALKRLLLQHPNMPGDAKRNFG